MKRLFIVLILIFCELFTCCTVSEEDSIIINLDSNIFTVGDDFTLGSFINRTGVYYESSDETIVKVNGYRGEAIACGDILIYAYSRIDNSLIKSILVSVISPKPSKITIKGESTVKVGEQIKLSIITEPELADYSVSWYSNDNTIATISDTGVITGVDIGLVTIEATSLLDTKVKTEHTIWVTKGAITDEEVSISRSESTQSINLSTLSGVLKPIIEKGQSSVVGINGYINNFGRKYLSTSATALVYKRYCITQDGEEILDDGTVTDIKGYKYYAITNKHIVEKMTAVEIYYDNNNITCEVIAYDQKIDLAVVTFNDTLYIPIADFGDSSEVNTGEFVVAIGNTYGSDYFKSASFGVVSYNSRYVGDDTDGDTINDWDALYIQHDAAVSEGSSGGPLLDMNGKVIAINTLKISDEKIDNMAFAIPSNLVLELVAQLEKGIVPERPVLGISVISIKDIIKNDVLLSEYDIPEGITEGMYISEVNSGGVGSAAGLMPGDILISFDGIKIRYSYELRAQINECIIGSGEEIELIVLRNGKETILKAVF